jgi:hypothetical protein
MAALFSPEPAVALPVGCSRFYQTRQTEPRLAAMLFGTGFLCAFSLGASLLNYLLLTRVGTRLDLQLAALHPRLNATALVVYFSMLPQVALLVIALATVERAGVYRFCLALDPAYANELVRLLHDGPGFISPRDTKGLVGFPSYHAVLALLVIWYARGIRFLRWPATLLNSAVLFLRWCRAAIT